MLLLVEQSTAMARPLPNPSSTASIAERLRITRAALGHTQVFMGSLTGAAAPSQTWQNYESGYRRISINHALALCAAVGLSLDWVYRGNIESLPIQMAEKIHLQMKMESADRRRRII